MKKSGLVAASVAAASATAYSVSSSSSSSSKSNISREGVVNDSSKKTEKKLASPTSTSSDKFAPRFDGLRFIETLVTAHR